MNTIDDLEEYDVTRRTRKVDINILLKLVRAEDKVILGDTGYTSDEYKRWSRQLGIRWCAQDKRKSGQNLSRSQKKRNWKHSSIRTQVKHVFRVIKRQLGFIRTCCASGC
ncbi:MAG: hypothetical protein E6Q59_02480 [Nitrosomonas sp.]|nr:MAG: hypothetical protein E6Q59_02480 [Nitrosomonas sp.]